MMSLLKKYPFFLLFLPLFIILHIEKNYAHLINYEFVKKELLILFISPLIIYFLCRLLLKPIIKANLFSFIVLFVFFFTGDIKDGLSKQFPDSIIQSYSLVLPLMTVIIYLSFFLIKRKAIHEKVIVYINTLGLTLIIISGISLIGRYTTHSDNTEKYFGDLSCKECNKPDIYYIIFDSYTSSGMLYKEFNYDNSGIENYLKETGFRIISESTSNYNLTPFSISSIFNMGYLNHADTSHVLHLKDYLPAVDQVYYTSLFPFIEKQGYKIYNHSIFDFKKHKSSVSSFDIWKINKIYQQFNIIKKTYNEIGWQLPSWLTILSSDRNNYIANRDKHDSLALQHLMTTIHDKSITEPKFVYNHFFLPHSPYSYDSSGKKIKSRHAMTPEEDKLAYVQQLVHVNTIMKNIIETIKTRSGNKAVIIIQGDHGYRFFDKNKNDLEFSNLNAIYFPDREYTYIPDSLTSVNTFRAVLNTLFDTKYPMLPNKTFFLKYK